ncbi:MAG: inositol monophosphatase [Candidatus Riflebacteria bacterium]|nr:inositol monophosphatase [Candidatus Riflebacteria bacterium]
MFEKEAKFAVEVAKNAGQILLERFRKKHNITFKGPVDLVTEADLASEKFIRKEIEKNFPADSMHGEESGGSDFSKGRVWVFDPLDGTTNFAHGLPIFAVSIALCIDGMSKVGVVYQPLLKECFSATEKGGAFLNGEPISVSHRAKISEALAVTGFPYNTASCINGIMPELRKMIIQTRGVRRLGSAAMDLCYVAAGYFDIFWEIDLKPWDVAAGALIASEAGGKVSDYSGEPHSIDRKEILATNSYLHEEVVKILKPVQS